MHFDKYQTLIYLSGCKIIQQQRDFDELKLSLYQTGIAY
jgi:hypothetical protein